MQEPLTEERRRAQRIKEKTRVFVCLGNPPYDREQHDPNDDRARRKGGWVRYGDEGLAQHRRSLKTSSRRCVRRAAAST